MFDLLQMSDQVLIENVVIQVFNSVISYFVIQNSKIVRISV
jgi:hypothetical protein